MSKAPSRRASVNTTAPKTTMASYLRSAQDKKEDAANAKIVGMKASVFKKTAPAKAIDRQIVKLDNRKTKTAPSRPVKSRGKK